MTTDVLPARVMEQRIARDENVVAFRRIRAHAHRVHLATVAERPDLAMHSAGEIVSIAQRRLRQLGGDAA
jgi:hypothetical protein